MVPLRSDTIPLVQNGCSFHGLWTEKLHHDILMFQQHHGESLFEAWTRFKDLLQKVPHYGIDRWLQIQVFYDYVSFHLKYEIDRTAVGKLYNKNVDESWEIIENLTLYDHEGWVETKEFVKLVKAISTPQGVSKTPDRRLLELEDQINFLLKGLLKEHTTRKTPEKVLIREEAKFPVTKNVNSVSLKKGEEERSIKKEVTPDNTKRPTETEAEMPVKKAETKNEAENGARNKSIKTPENEEAMEAPGYQLVAYYLKHKINDKLIEGLVDNNRFNNSLDVSEGKCAGLKGKKPKTVDNKECESSKQSSKKGDGRKAVNEKISNTVKERWDKKKKYEKKRDNLNLGDGGGLNMISDVHKGLIRAVADWLPNAENKQCTRHIYVNFKKR
nr:zinc finger, CCHC-type [Tanacetum cinerariifolium]